MIIYHLILNKNAGKVLNAEGEYIPSVSAAGIPIIDHFLSKIYQEFIYKCLSMKNLHTRNLNIILQYK